MYLKTGLSLSGILCIFGGTFVLSRILLLHGLKKEAEKKLIKDNKPMNKFYVFIARYMFGIKKELDSLDLLDPVNPDTIRVEEQSIDEPIRGMLWIMTGSILQAIAMIDFNRDLNKVVIIATVLLIYIFLLIKDNFKKAR